MTCLPRNDPDVPASGCPADARVVSEAGEALRVDALAVEIGVGWVPRVAELVERIGILRAVVAAEMGVLLPPVRLRDHTARPADAYALLLHGVEIASGRLSPDAVVLLGRDGEPPVFPDAEHVGPEPAHGFPAAWIPAARREEAERAGCVVVAPSVVLVEHVGRIARQRAADWLDAQSIRRLLEVTASYAPDAVREAEATFSSARLRMLMRRRLACRGSLRPLPVVLEAWVEARFQVGDDDIDALVDTANALLEARWRPDEPSPAA